MAAGVDVVVGLGVAGLGVAVFVGVVDLAGNGVGSDVRVGTGRLSSAVGVVVGEFVGIQTLRPR